MKIFIAILFISTSLFAQEDKYERIRALKTAYITEELNLSPSEAEKFWPIYNVYDDKLLQLRITKRKALIERAQEGMDAMTEVEANELLDQTIEIQISELNYRRELINKLRKIMSAKEIVLLSQVEQGFKRKLLKQYRGQKNR